MNCLACGGSSREGDRFCLRCGAVVDLAASPITAGFDSHVATDRWYHRAGDVLLDHFKATVVVIMITVFVGLGVLGVFDEKAVPENRASPGYEMVRELKSAGHIDDFKAVEPADDWQSEYSLNDGSAHIRFDEDRMEIDAKSYETDLADSVGRVARASGFASSDGS